MITFFEINDQLQTSQDIINKNRGNLPSSNISSSPVKKQSYNNVSNILDKQKNINKNGVKANQNSEQNISTTKNVILNKQPTPTKSIPDTKPQLGRVSRI